MATLPPLRTNIVTPALRIFRRPWAAFLLPAACLALAGHYATGPAGLEGPARLLFWIALGLAAASPALVVHVQLRGFERRQIRPERIDPFLAPTMSADTGFPAADAAAGPVPCDLGTVAGMVRAGLADAARRKGLRLDIVADTDALRPVVTDAGRLARLLIDLGRQAIGRTEHGGVTVRIVQRDASLSGVLLRFSVEDTAAGISRELQARLFGTTADRREPGFAADEMAPGLAAARTLADALGGRLRLSRDPGVGLRHWFELRLPFAADPADREPAPVEAKRVLLIGPDTRALRDGLARDGHEVRVAASGDDALGILRGDGGWDAVLIDAGLADMPAGLIERTCRFGLAAPAAIHIVDADADLEAARRLLAEARCRAQEKPAETVAPRLRAVPVVWVDEAAFARFTGIGPDFGAQLIAGSIEGIRARAHELLRAFGAGELECARDAAHALAALASDVGALRLSRLASAIVREGSESLASRRDRLIGELREATERTLEALEALRSRQPDLGTGTGG